MKAIYSGKFVFAVSILAVVTGIFVWSRLARDTGSQNPASQSPDTTAGGGGDSARSGGEATKPPLTGTPNAVASSKTVAEADAAERDFADVQLSAEKQLAVGVKTSAVAAKQLQQTHTVPGRLRYDDRRHVEVRGAAAGILTAINVKPGDRVAAGDVIAELNSPEVGNARADMLQRQAELQLVTERRNWEQSTGQGLDQLNTAILKRVPMDQIREQFREIPLGAAREKALTAYSHLLLSESLLQAATDNADTGIMSRKIMQERQNERERAEAALSATMEQLVFESRQDFREAQNAVEDAERRLTISRQSVRSLLGFSSLPENAEEIAEPATLMLSRVVLRAPFAGTVERLNFSISERVNAGDSVCIVADTSTLWVAADLRDRDRAALMLQPGDPVEVFLTEEHSRTVPAVVNYVGREVDPLTNAIPLIAVIQNPDSTLRPGMFVSVRVPVGPRTSAITVPESAVAEHEARRFVFVPEQDGRYRRVDVTTGQQCGDQIVIASGLREGQEVVVDGVFSLKSELLLSGEE